MNKWVRGVVMVLMFLCLASAAYASALEAEDGKAIFGSGLLIDGPCRPLKILMRGLTAGDNIGIYDNSPTKRAGVDIAPFDIKDLECELTISANTAIAVWDAAGKPFKYGLRILASTSTILTSAVWDY
jgi:hypothetical protein